MWMEKLGERLQPVLLPWCGSSCIGLWLCWCLFIFKSWQSWYVMVYGCLWLPVCLIKQSKLSRITMTRNVLTPVDETGHLFVLSEVSNSSEKNVGLTEFTVAVYLYVWSKNSCWFLQPLTWFIVPRIHTHIYIHNIICRYTNLHSMRNISGNRAAGNRAVKPIIKHPLAFHPVHRIILVGLNIK